MKVCGLTVGLFALALLGAEAAEEMEASSISIALNVLLVALFGFVGWGVKRFLDRILAKMDEMQVTTISMKESLIELKTTAAISDRQESQIVELFNRLHEVELWKARTEGAEGAKS